MFPFLTDCHKTILIIIIFFSSFLKRFMIHFPAFLTLLKRLCSCSVSLVKRCKLKNDTNCNQLPLSFVFFSCSCSQTDSVVRLADYNLVVWCLCKNKSPERGTHADDDEKNTSSTSNVYFALARRLLELFIMITHLQASIFIFPYFFFAFCFSIFLYIFYSCSLFFALTVSDTTFAYTQNSASKQIHKI